jgi:histidinol-phosphate/aromatic aminotransferase/cobyric acid decarboxylase-like protein
MNLRLHGDTVAAAGVLDFAVNVWPGPRAPALEQALAEAVAGTRYPSEVEAREALAARHGRTFDEVLLLNGACEAFWLLAHAVRPPRATCVHPAFTEPEAALRAIGADLTQVFRQPDDWALDAEQVPEEAEFVVVGNPNNPTGAIDSPDEICALLRPGRLVVIDESFMDFVGDDASLAGLSLPGLVVVRSLTKLWSLAGVRAGYLLGPPDLVALLSNNRQPWSVNAPACAALAYCASDTETPARVRAQVCAERAYLEAGLESFGLTVWSSAANFFLVNTGEGEGLRHKLLAAGIALRPAASFPGLDSDYLRIAVRGRADNDRLLVALGEVT